MPPRFNVELPNELTLPIKLLIHKTANLNRTSRTPDAVAIIREKINARDVRVTAMICQSQRSPARWLSAPIEANANAPQHREVGFSRNSFLDVQL